MQVFSHPQEKYAMEVHVHFKTRNIAERVSLSVRLPVLPCVGHFDDGSPFRSTYFLPR